jgi:hypothetical protein
MVPPEGTGAPEALVKRRDADSLKIGNNWVNITQTSNCNLLQEQYSFQRSKHFLNMCAICSLSRANYKIKTLPTSMFQKVQEGPIYCTLITQSSQHLAFHKPFYNCILCISDVLILEIQSNNASNEKRWYFSLEVNFVFVSL